MDNDEINEPPKGPQANIGKPYLQSMVVKVPHVEARQEKKTIFLGGGGILTRWAASIIAVVQTVLSLTLSNTLHITCKALE